MNAYSMATEEASRVSDIFFHTIRKGVVTLPQLADSFGNVASIAGQAVPKLEDTMAAIQVLTKSGTDSRRAMTSLRQIIQTIIDPTKQVRKEAMRLGIDFSSAALKTRGLVGVMEQVNEATAGADEAITKLFPNMRALVGAIVLAGSKTEEFRTAFEETVRSTGEAEVAFQKMYSTVGHMGKRATIQIGNIAIALGDQLLPAIATTMQSWFGFSDAIENATQKSFALVRVWFMLAGVFKGLQAIVSGALALVLQVVAAFRLTAANLDLFITDMGLRFKLVGLGVAEVFMGLVTLVMGMMVKFDKAVSKVLGQEYDKEFESAHEAMQKRVDELGLDASKVNQELEKVGLAWKELEKVDPLTQMAEGAWDKALEQWGQSGDAFGDMLSSQQKLLDKFNKQYLEETEEAVSEAGEAYDAAADAARAAEFEKERAIYSHIERMTEYASKGYKEQSDIYQDEIRSRVQAHEQFIEDIKRLDEERSRYAMSWTDKHYRAMMGKLSPKGQAIQTRAMAQTYETRARGAFQKGDAAEAIRLMKKSQDFYLKLFDMDELSKKESNDAMRRAKRSHSIIMELYDQQKQKLQNQKRGNVNRIDDLFGRLRQLENRLKTNLKLDIDTQEAKEAIDAILAKVEKIASVTSRMSAGAQEAITGRKPVVAPHLPPAAAADILRSPEPQMAAPMRPSEGVKEFVSALNSFKSYFQAKGEDKGITRMGPLQFSFDIKGKEIDRDTVRMEIWPEMKALVEREMKLWFKEALGSAGIDMP
jgi:hypothetical protein